MCCPYHKSCITYAAQAFTITAFIFSTVGIQLWGILAFLAGLVSLVIVMCTCCVKVPKVALYGAAFGALVSWIANVVEAAELKCSEEDEDDGLCEIKKLERISAILASVIWIAAVGLIVSIPVHDRAKNNNSEGEDNQGSKNELEVA